MSSNEVRRSVGPVVLAAHLKKLKTLKKKYFVLRAESHGSPACLEYYDSKRKFDARQPPKRSISVRSCFNINRRRDTKHKHVIALYTKDECFCLVLDSESDLEEWLNQLLLLQNGEPIDGEQPKPTFEHIWQVTISKKGLGERKGINGPYRLCLTNQTLTLVKLGSDDKKDSLEFWLNTIRRCGGMDKIFYLEVGRSAVTGVGEFWMEVEDSNIGENMFHAINNAMINFKAKTKDQTLKDKDDGPKQRMRSSSANEASKPISVIQRRHTTQKLHGFSPLGVPAIRDRCDSLPSRARTTSEGHMGSSLGISNHVTTVIAGHTRTSSTTSSSTATTVIPCIPSNRPHSIHNRVMSYSPPVNAISPASGACSTDSAGSSLSMDDTSCEHMDDGMSVSQSATSHHNKYGHSLTPDEPVILEENSDDYVPWGHSDSQQHKFSSGFKACSPSQQSSYVEMCSPSGSSPGKSAYMPMSPATSGHLHSRTSSLVEDSSMTLPDGYVPMAPVGDDGYVDMDPISNHHHVNGHFPDDMSHGGSSCSVTSGTPSTDLRFSEYHLDKVTSFLAPGEELQQARPTRAYSVGSRPEPANRHRKNSFPNFRLDIAQQESSRVRAFSVGSRLKRPEISRITNVVTAPLVAGIDCSQNSNKSNSAPLLSSSWGHASGCSANSERMEDLMELDFTKPHNQVPLSSPPLSTYSQSQSYSTATDTSSYVDMSPGQPPITTTAPYVDMNGLMKLSRNNNNSCNSSSQNNNVNNNNNIATANHNHNNSLTIVASHKPIITQASPLLKPVEEAESPYMFMDRTTSEDWSQTRVSPKQVPSPCQDDYMQMNGPPGGTRTAPVDLPQPRRPPDGYVEMSFKARPNLEQDYMNMSLGLARNQRNQRLQQNLNNNNNRKKKCSLPIAIQAGGKTSKTTTNFQLPLNDGGSSGGGGGSSPSSESLASTPASPPRVTPTSSSAIFPFSLNSPQSPIKPFTNRGSEVAFTSLPHPRKISAPSPLPGVDGCPSSKKAHDNPDCPTSINSTINRQSVTNEKLNNPVVTTSSNIAASTTSNTVAKTTVYTTLPPQDSTTTTTTHPLSPITKKLSDLTVSKPPRLITASPATSPTPSGFKPIQVTKPVSPKVVEDTTPTPSLTPTPTPTPSPLDSEGYEKLQPGATLLHYAKLDLPEITGVPPVSPTPGQEGFSYAEIDFAKLRQN